MYEKHRELLVSNDFHSRHNHREGVAAEPLTVDGGQETVEVDEDDNSHDSVPVDNTRIAAMFILRTTEVQRASQVGNYFYARLTC